MNDYYRNLNVDIGYIFRVLRGAVVGHWGKVLAFTSLSAVTAYLLSLNLEPQYRAAATMHVAQRDTAVFDVRELMMKRRDPAYQATQVGVIESRILVQKVVAEHDLQNSSSFVETDVGGLSRVLSFIVGDDEKEELDEATRLKIATEQVQESLSVVPRQKSYLIDIIVQRPNPEEAALIANSLADAYISRVRDQEREDSERSQNWLLERIQTVSEELQAAETELQVYKERWNIIGDSKRSQGFVAQEVDTLSEKYLAAREERLALETLHAQILAIESADGDLQGIAALQMDPVVQNVKRELLELNKTHSELSRRYGPEHRRMIELNSKIEGTSRELDQQTQRVIAAIKSNYELAVRNERFHETNLQQSTDRVQDLSRRQGKLISLEQNVATQRDIYEAFLKRLNRSEATDDDINTNVRLVDPAQTPRRAMPNKTTAIVIGVGLLGFILSGLAAVVREWFDASIFRAADVESKLGVAVLSQVPLIEENESQDSEVPASYTHYTQQPFSAYAESIRGIRSSLMLSSISRKKTRVLITSTVPSEGKTSMAIGLAASLGQIRKTVLVDADLRRPSIHALIMDDSARRLLGLSDLCIGTAPGSECIHALPELGIDVIPAGSVTPNPQELFCSTEFAELLNSVSEQYDYVVIDSPPCGALTDSHMLSAQIDQLLYVVKAGETPVQRIRASLFKLKNFNAPIAGVVLNQTDEKDGAYGYYYYNKDGNDQTVKQVSAIG